jgi:hypothetical protein
MRSRLLLVLLTLAVPACNSMTSEPVLVAPVGIVFAFEGFPADTMIVTTNRPETIAAAKAYIATHRGPRLLAGTIVRGSGPDPRYPFQFVPETVQLIGAAIELCDGAPMRTEAAVNDFFLASQGSRNAPAATWCPWSSYPIAVIDAP